MNETLDQALKDVIANATAAKQFLIDQIPDVLHQLIVWNMAKSCFIAAMLLIVAAVLTRMAIKVWKHKPGYDDGSVRVGAIAIGTFGVAPTLIFASIQILQLIELWLAPKVWLIEYAAGLVHK